MGFGAQVHLLGEDKAWCAGEDEACAGLRLSELMLLLQGWGSVSRAGVCISCGGSSSLSRCTLCGDGVLCPGTMFRHSFRTQAITLNRAQEMALLSAGPQVTFSGEP